MDHRISIEACPDYSYEGVRKAMEALFDKTDALAFVKPGMTIALKTNLITGMDPARGATTHPMVLGVLSQLLIQRGATVVIGDSPGGLFTEGALKHAYRLSKLEDAVAFGARLNEDLSTREIAHPEAKLLKSFTATEWLLKADAVISCCKLKTHGMMAMTANVKNLFGVIPGTMKGEYHFRFPNHRDFADMLVDINTYIRPALYLTDAVVGMEGNGPTGGSPRQIGCLMASADPFALDVVCAHIIGLDPESVPYIKAAHDRGLCSCEPDGSQLLGDYRPFIQRDFDNIRHLKSIEFDSYVPKWVSRLGRILLDARPRVSKGTCVGCGKCAKVCPAKAIVMKNRLPVIDIDKCIRCFCCQEFCPKSAMKVQRSLIARLLLRK